MKKISRWAANNVAKARALVVLCNLLLLVLGLIGGFYLYVIDIYTNPTVIYALMGLFMLGYGLYPKKGIKIGLFKHSYYRQKFHDFLLNISTFLIVVFAFGNYLTETPSLAFQQEQQNSYVRLIVHKNSKALEKNEKKGWFGRMKAKWKAYRTIKKTFKKWKQKVKSKEGQISDLGKIGLWLLYLALWVGAIYGLLVLACVASCGGAVWITISFLILLVIVPVHLVKIGRYLHKITSDTPKEVPE